MPEIESAESFAAHLWDTGDAATPHEALAVHASLVASRDKAIRADERAKTIEAAVASVDEAIYRKFGAVDSCGRARDIARAALMALRNAREAQNKEESDA